MKPDHGEDGPETVEVLRGKLEEYERHFGTLDQHIRVLEGERRKFSALLNHSDASFIMVDRDLHAVWSNERFRSQFGGADNVAGLLEHRSEVLSLPFRTGEAAHHEIALDLEGRLRHLYVTAAPIRSTEGEVEECIVMLQDITDLRILQEADDALRTSEERFRTIFEHVGAAMFTCTPNGRFLQVNPGFCEMLGYGESALIQKKTLVALTHPADLKKLQVQLSQVTSGVRRVMEMETRYIRKDGWPVSCRTRAVWLLDAVGRPRYAVVLVQDLRAEKRTMAELMQSQQEQREVEETLREREEQLQQAQKMEAIGRLAGGIAHDFNNLLTAISGYSRLLLRRLGRHDPMQREVLEISKAADRAAALTGQLLAFSRRQVLKPKVLDLNAGINDVGKLLRRVIGEDIDLVTNLPRDLGVVRADPGQIQQVLMNLVVNARDAMPRGGSITIETANVELDESYAEVRPGLQPGSYVILSVSDTGSGMDAETKAKIFEPFFTTKEQGKGTGLGLATVYGIVKQSGGNIFVKSEIDQGTTFNIYLPRVTGEAVDLGNSAHTMAEVKRGTETVLLAEDDESVRTLAEEVLREAGYKVLTACDGNEALVVSNSHDSPIQLLVTDIIMPQVGGTELAKRLQPKRPEMIVLYISGYTDDAVFREGLPEENSFFLQKPFTPADLATKVREVLDQDKASNG